MVMTRNSYWALWEEVRFSSLARAYLEADIDDMRPTNRLMGLLGRDGGVTITCSMY